MFRSLLFVPLLLLIAHLLPGQNINFRHYDGSGNNMSNPDWGAANTPLRQRTDLGYSDGISAPGGLDRPNPRVISNALFRQDNILPDAMGLSDYCWVFGQFIDHDITLTPDSDNEMLMIDVPTGDPWFDPFNSGNVQIPMRRTAIVEGTGTSTDNPRRHFNAITAFLDASAVYGSSEERALWLRSYDLGKLKVSQGNLLPFNTITGEFDSPIDPEAPHMDDAVGLSPKHFVAGDARANENPLLLSFHTLFVREHNRQCDLLLRDHPRWRDEQLYQEARKRVGAIMQAIVFEEWLPAMGVALPDYQGYRSDVNPTIFNVFAAAAFRMGHTLLNGNILRLDNNGETLPQGNLMLRDAFFNPMLVYNDGGIEPYFKGMGVQMQQSFDAKVLDDVRNFLFGPPGAGGLDLAAININRGRERGLPDYNTIRENFGLPRVTEFSQINPNPDVAQTLEQLYGAVDQIDPWVGMLSEKSMDDALFGPTVMAIMMEQFRVIRDGDRFYYENDPTLSPAEKQAIKNTRLYDILMRNTDLEIMQPEVFRAMPHEEICLAEEDFASMSGVVSREDGQLLPEVTLEVYQNGDPSVNTLTGASGDYLLPDLVTCEKYVLRPVLNDDVRNGVSTWDLVLITKHILNITRLNSPYRMLAADVNNSGSVTTLDIVAIRKVILGVSQEFPSGQSWRFVDASYVFPDPANPWAEPVPTVIQVNRFDQDAIFDFTAFKLGDVDNSARIDNLVAVDDRDPAADAVVLRSEDRMLAAGELVRVPVYADETEDLAGIQFTLELNAGLAEVLAVDGFGKELLPNVDYAWFRQEGALTLSWNGTLSSGDGPLFELVLRATQPARLTDLLGLSSRLTAAEAYTHDLRKRGLRLQIGSDISVQLAAQVRPNPFRDEARILLDIPVSGQVQFLLTDIGGHRILERELVLESGQHSLQVSAPDLPSTGVYFYRIQTSSGILTGKLVHID